MAYEVFNRLLHGSRIFGVNADLAGSESVPKAALFLYPCGHDWYLGVFCNFGSNCGVTLDAKRQNGYKIINGKF